MDLLGTARPMLADVLRREEGLRLKPYLCSAGVATIGVGATTYPDGRRVRLEDPEITEEKALRMLAIECDFYLMHVTKLCTVYPTSGQLASMASLAYNIGLGAFEKSSVLKAHNRGDFAAASRAFALWNKATVGGKLTVLPGLVTRRAREAALYLTPDEGTSLEPMPQAVAPESSLAKSPMMTAGGALPVAAGAISVVAEAINPVEAVTQAGQHASTVQTALTAIKTLIVDTVGIPQSLWLPLVLIGAGVTVMWWRKKQRAGGWA